MKKSKGQTVDLLYKTKENSKRPKQTKKKKAKNKDKKSDNGIINLDNEIIIGMTLKEEPRKNEKKKNLANRKTKQIKNNV